MRSYRAALAVQREVSRLREDAAGLAIYRQGRFGEAAAAVQAAADDDPADGPARALLERCKRYRAAPPPLPFDGVLSLAK